MVMLTLASLATLLALRNLWVNDQLLNAEADHLRTQLKAEAALAVARLDISAPLTADNVLRHTPGSSTHTHAFFPTSLTDYTTLQQRLGTSGCSSGICAPNDLNGINKLASHWQGQIATAMPVSAADTPYGEHTAWYWVEVFPLADSDAFVYRITTLANGVLPGSSTVLQAIWTRSSPASPSGVWHSWHVLHK